MKTLQIDAGNMDAGTERRDGPFPGRHRAGHAARWNAGMPGGRLLVCCVLTGCVLFCLWCFPARADAREDTVEDLLKRGEELYQTHHLAPGRFEEAIRFYEKALAFRPDDYGILWKLSDMYENCGEMLDASQKERKISCWKKGAEYGRRAVAALVGIIEGTVRLPLRETLPAVLVPRESSGGAPARAGGEKEAAGAAKGGGER